LEARYRELTTQLREQGAQRDAEMQERETRIARLNAEIAEAKREGQEQTRKIALEAIRLMDVLDWTQAALRTRGEAAADLVPEVASAQRDCLRRLAAVGITEIPCQGMMDGRLHEGLETVPEAEATVPRYHIVRMVRRGWQCGADILRRAGVVTAG
jgi:molecular chaperone GrpE (heat shock protein)